MVARNPIIVLFMGLMVVYTLVNDLGVIGTIRGYDMPIDYAKAILSDVGFVNPFMGGFFVLLTLCLGVVSIADERSKGSLGVMLAKPLYRRDLILGKLTGIAAFLLLLMTITFVFFVSSLIVVYGNIGSMMEVIIRMSLFIFLLFAYCCFTLGVVALFSILFSKGAALVASLAYFCYEWYSYGFIAPSDPFFGALRRFDPVQIFWNPLINVKGSGLQDTALPLGEWINYSWPYITLLVLYVIIIMLVDSMIFNREEI